jgi:histidyl-tRNA synthetase
MSNTNPARGMRDFLPSDVRKREYVIGIIKEVYESYGFEPLETPAVENIETLMGKYGEEGNQLIFKILKRGEKLEESLGSRDSLESLESGESTSSTFQTSTTSQTNQLADLALRYDLTVPLARVVANRKNDLPKFFKRYQIQPVWRADRPARGRFREFYQCDVDAIGSSSATVDAEIISAVCRIMTELDFDNFSILLNHRELLQGALEVCGIKKEDHGDALVALDKLDKIGKAGVLAELRAKQLFTEESVEQVGRFIDTMSRIGEPFDSSGDSSIDRIRRFESLNNATIARLSDFIGDNTAGKKGIAAISEILALTKNNSAAGRIDVFPNLARGLSYYTGAIMELGIPHPSGNNKYDISLGGGGRYDGLIGMFGKEQIPACGFSLGLERILVVMDERGMFPPEIASNASADVMVTIWNEDSIGESLKLANELRSQNLRVLLYPEPDKLGKQFKYASQLNIPWVCVLGESELAENKVTLKNMKTGEQKTIELDQLYGEIKKKSSS